MSSYNSILSWVTKAKALSPAPSAIFVFTGVSRTGAANGNGQTGDQYIQALATRIRNGAVANGYTVIDVQSDPNIGCTSCNSNLTYFQDGIHPTQFTYNIIGNKWLLPALIAAGF